MPIRCRVVAEMPGLEVSAADRRAVRDIVAWAREPSFAVPGRTAWHVLADPVVDPVTSRPLVAAKIKGVGAWVPGEAATPPSVTAYPPTTRNHHVGIDADGCFAPVHSEPAPYGAMTLPRARQEFDNAATLYRAGVPAVVPLAVHRYDDGRTFGGHPLGAVVSLAWDESPYSLDLLRVENPAAPAAERAHVAAVRERLGHPPNRTDGASVLAVRAAIGRQVGARLRELAQAGLYRYSAGWDNVHLDRRTAVVYLTDLDSTRELAELPHPVRGMQALRDLAGGIYQIANKLYHPSAIDAYDLRTLLDTDPLAAVVEGYFGIDDATARRLARPLWAYFVPHWFLLKRLARRYHDLSKDARKDYKMSMDVCYALAVLALAGPYRTRHESLGLPPCPSDEELRRRMRGFLGEAIGLLDHLTAAPPTV